MINELTVLHDDGVLEVPVSLAGAGNALDRDAVLAGREALQAVLRGRLRAGAVLLTGRGDNFCAGGNVKSFHSADDRKAYLRGLAHDLHGLLSDLYATRLPTVAAVRGWAAGAGMSVALHADFSVGGPSTRMRSAYPGIGLSPDGGMSWILPRIVGLGRARTILMGDEVLDADTALRLSLLSELVDDDRVESRAREIAVDLAAGPHGSYAAIRRLLFDSWSNPLHDQLHIEAESISTLAASPEGIEGVNAFVEKRTPDFRAARG
ncbi:MAG: enoyl-CoA hydratase-related protein [Gordonia sp. (in: high G+C Gram-positive bacteria)]|uniref:enoyl-CoA hydratase/isomerase family protein n=1 Tax=Gordonia sp. (in: high G+C Gram-positive bacteria) TaxID=84139 RepID=UPI0039E57558